MNLEMKVKRTNNGWILNFTGHDCLDKTFVFNTWTEVLAELEEYFIQQFGTDKGKPYDL